MTTTQTSARVPALPLARAIRMVAPAASGDKERPTLCGVNIAGDGGHVVFVAATNSYRLLEARVPAAVAGEISVTVSPSWADDLERLGGMVTLVQRGRGGEVSATVDGAEAPVPGASLRDFPFPDYRTLWPDPDAETAAVLSVHAGVLASWRKAVPRSALKCLKTVPGKARLDVADGSVSMAIESGSARRAAENAESARKLAALHRRTEAEWRERAADEAAPAGLAERWLAAADRSAQLAAEADKDADQAEARAGAVLANLPVAATVADGGATHYVRPSDLAILADAAGADAAEVVFRPSGRPWTAEFDGGRMMAMPLRITEVVG